MARVVSSVWDRLRRREGAATPESMFGPSPRTATPASTSTLTVSDRSYEYSPQAAEDHEGRIAEYYAPGRKMNARGRPSKGSSHHKPTPLTWPFIVAQICLLCIAMALVIYIRDSMPDSDSTAQFERRDLHSTRIVPSEDGLAFRRIAWLKARQEEEEGQQGDQIQTGDTSKDDVPPPVESPTTKPEDTTDDNTDSAKTTGGSANPPVENKIEEPETSTNDGGNNENNENNENDRNDQNNGDSAEPTEYTARPGLDPSQFAVPGTVVVTDQEKPTDTTENSNNDGDEGDKEANQPGNAEGELPADRFPKAGTKTLLDNMPDPTDPPQEGGTNGDDAGDEGSVTGKVRPSEDFANPGTFTLVDETPKNKQDPPQQTDAPQQGGGGDEGNNEDGENGGPPPGAGTNPDLGEDHFPKPGTTTIEDGPVETGGEQPDGGNNGNDEGTPGTGNSSGGGDGGPLPSQTPPEDNFPQPGTTTLGLPVGGGTDQPGPTPDPSSGNHNGGGGNNGGGNNNDGGQHNGGEEPTQEPGTTIVVTPPIVTNPPDNGSGGGNNGGGGSNNDGDSGGNPNPNPNPPVDQTPPDNSDGDNNGGGPPTDQTPPGDGTDGGNGDTPPQGQTPPGDNTGDGNNNGGGSGEGENPPQDQTPPPGDNNDNGGNNGGGENPPKDQTPPPNNDGGNDGGNDNNDNGDDGPVVVIPIPDSTSDSGSGSDPETGIFGGPAPTTDNPKPTKADGGQSNPPASPSAPVPITVIETKPPTPTTIVETPPPETIVIPPTDNPNANPNNPGSSITTVTTRPPTTRITTLPGSTTTKVILWRPSSKATTLTMLPVIGGTATTIITTPPPRTKTVTLNNGVVVTEVITQPGQKLVTTVGGTTKTITTVIQPDVREIVITTFVVKTIGGTTLHITKTQPAETNVKTVDGHPITEVITPAPTVEETVVGGTLSTLWTVITLSPLPIASSTPTDEFPKPTSVGDSDESNQGGPRKYHTRVFKFTNADYFVGTFLPTLIAVGLSIPLTIIDLNAKLYQPFNSLVRPGGAAAVDSMTLKFYAHHAFITPCALLFQGLPVTFVTSLLVWLSWLLTPLVAEAIGMKVHGTCKANDFHGCGAQLGVSIVPSHILVALLAFMIVLLLVLLFLLRKWDTGVSANPWCIAGIASLISNRDTRDPLIKRPDLLRDRTLDPIFHNKGYQLGLFTGRGGQDQYGIIPLESAAGLTLNNDRDHNVPIAPVMGGALGADAKGALGFGAKGERRRNMPFLALTYAWRGIFAFFLACVLSIIAYYHALDEDNAFERFMDDWRHFGVRFLFAAIGVAITFFWTCFFLSLAAMAPFHNMSRGPQPPHRSILLTRPTNPFSGLYSSYTTRNLLLATAALMTIFAEFLPILLANIPFQITHTYISHVVCTRLTMAILALMILTLLASMLVRFPHMPVDPRTIAGHAFYCCDSLLVTEFKGHQLSMLGAKERRERVAEMGKRYFYGEIIGTSGSRRVGVEGDEVAHEVPAEEGNFI